MTLSNTIDAALRAALNAASGAVRRRKQEAVKANIALSAPLSGQDADVVIGVTVPSRLQILQEGAKAGHVPVSLTVAERRMQTYVHGSTGTGKSVLLTTLLDADIEAGRSVVVLDARGDLIDRILARLTARFPLEAMRERLALLDLRQHAPYQMPGGDSCCAGFNPLREAGGNGYASGFFCFDAIASQFEAGVQTAELLRNCLLALALTEEPCTLLDIENLLFSEGFRRNVLRTVKDASVRRFFERRLPELLEAPQYAASLLNRLSPYTSVPALRRLLGMRAGGISFREFLDRPGSIFLACLGADELHSGAALVGSLIISAVAKSVMRSDRPVARRRETVFLYMDEFMNFGNSPASNQTLIEIISEGRRFGLGAVMAHQSTAQLDPKLRNLLRNIVGNQFYFACGGSDSDLLAGELPSDEPKPVLRNRLISLPVGSTLLLRRGRPLVQVQVSHSPDPDVPAERVAALRAQSLERWGRPKAEVDAEIERAMDGTAGAEPPEKAFGLEVREAADAGGAPRKRRPREGRRTS